MNKATDQRGAVSRITVLVLSLLLIAGVLAVVAWRMSNNDIDSELQETLDNASCEFVEDENLCKFLVSWNARGDHTIDATKSTEDSTVTYVLRAEDGAFHLETSGDESGETIGIGSTVYTRSDDGTWYEQTVDNINEYKLDNNFDFVEPTSQEEADGVQYTRGSTETCGDRTCLTYQVEGVSGNGSTMRIWFDDQEYRLRQVRITGDTGYTYDASISYGNVDIQAPAETTALAEGQTIPPGQTSPTSGEVQGESDNSESLPATGDQFDPEEYRQWLEQRQATQ